MCEKDSFPKTDKPHDWSVSRRFFMAASLTGAVSACVSANGIEPSLVEEIVEVQTPDGTMDAFFVRPSSGKHPAIITWPDIAGLRDAFKVMARRLAGQGYAVLVANPYYRSSPAPHFADFSEFRQNDGFKAVSDMRALLTPDAIMRDAGALIGWLDAQDSVDTGAAVGTHGYCMGGPFTVFTAAAQPQRVKAAASLHGGGLVKQDDAKSPHLLLAETEASYLIAIAQNDDAESPEAKTILRQSAENADVTAEIEVYPADHGWTVIDSPAYAKEAAEKAWARMSALFQQNL